MKKQKNTRPPARSTGIPIWLWVGLAVVLVAAVGVFLLLQPQNSSAPASSLPATISVAEAARARDAGAFILDVRQPSEWNEYHIAGATLIPLGELAANLDKAPRDREIVVVCHSGNRSGQGRDVLLKAGYTQVTSMAGGLIQWQAAGYPTVTGP